MFILNMTIFDYFLNLKTVALAKLIVISKNSCCLIDKILFSSAFSGHICIKRTLQNLSRNCFHVNKEA